MTCGVKDARTRPGPSPESRRPYRGPAALSAHIAALSCSRLCKGRVSVCQQTHVLADSVFCGLGWNWRQTSLQQPPPGSKSRISGLPWPFSG